MENGKWKGENGKDMERRKRVSADNSRITPFNSPILSK